MNWRVIFAGPARRDLRRLDPPIATRITQAIERFAETGQGDVRRLTDPNLNARYALRIGDWRILFNRDVPNQSLIIVRVLPRQSAYD